MRQERIKDYRGEMEGGMPTLAVGEAVASVRLCRELALHINRHLFSGGRNMDEDGAEGARLAMLELAAELGSTEGRLCLAMGEQECTHARLAELSRAAAAAEVSLAEQRAEQHWLENEVNSSAEQLAGAYDKLYLQVLRQCVVSCLSIALQAILARHLHRFAHNVTWFVCAAHYFARATGGARGNASNHARCSCSNR